MGGCSSRDTIKANIQRKNVESADTQSHQNERINTTPENISSSPETISPSPENKTPSPQSQGTAELNQESKGNTANNTQPAIISPSPDNVTANLEKQSRAELNQHSKGNTATNVQPTGVTSSPDNITTNPNKNEPQTKTSTNIKNPDYFDETKMVKIAIPGSSGKLVSEIHFNAGSAPLAPIKEGGAYILYSDKSTSQLKVIRVDNNGNKTGEDIDLGVKGSPFDIITVPWGFVILANNRTANHKLFVMGFTHDGKSKFTRTLIDTPKDPSTANKDQIIFKDHKDGKPLFGLQAIFDPHNGRLAWLNGRIGIIFAHYNFFGMKGGHRDCHTADTFITLDENGKDEKLGFAWGTSHSLNQQLIANEDCFVTVSLGDAYPVNIKGYRIWNNQEVLVDTQCPTTKNKGDLAVILNEILVEGDVVGNGSGGSCGRLGGLVYLKSKNLFAFVYSRRKCTDNYSGKKMVNLKNELAVVFMDEYLNVVKTVVIGDGEFINLIKTAKYGNNLLIQYNTTNRKDPRYPNNQYLHYETVPEDQTFMMMIDFDGKVVTPPKLMKDMHASPSDDFEQLSDGRVAWTYVDPNSGEISYFYYGPPPSEDLPAKSNSAELAQKPENIKKMFGAVGMANCLNKLPVQIISPLSPIINTSEKSIAIKLKFPSDLKLYASLEDLKGKKFAGLTRTIKEEGDITTISALLPGNGEFKILANFECKEWCEFYVKSNMKEVPDVQKLGFASMYSVPEEIVLLEPWEKYLQRGSTQHFKLQSTKATQVVAIVNGKWLKLPKNGDIFEGDVVLDEAGEDFTIWASFDGANNNVSGAVAYKLYD